MSTTNPSRITSSVKVLRKAQVKELTGLPYSTMYKYIAEGTFPKQIALGVRSVGWLESEVLAWISLRIEQRGVSLARTR